MMKSLFQNMWNESLFKCEVMKIIINKYRLLFTLVNIFFNHVWSNISHGPSTGLHILMAFVSPLKIPRKYHMPRIGIMIHEWYVTLRGVSLIFCET